MEASSGAVAPSGGTSMLAAFATFIVDETGLTSVEYAILLALVAAIAVGAWDALVSPGPSLHTARAPSQL